jgi:antitoxin VapB
VPETRKAKLFRNGASQAVRLPAEFHFAGTEIYATRDERSGEVTLSARPGARGWAEFFALMRTIDVPADLMSDRPMNLPPRAARSRQNLGHSPPCNPHAAQPRPRFCNRKGGVKGRPLPL